MTWLTVITNPRRPQYLRETLEELDRAGAAQLAREGKVHRVLAVDGYLSRVPNFPGWTKVQVGSGDRGNRRPMALIMRLAAKYSTGDMLYFEDDVICCPNAVLALYEHRIPYECGFATAFVFRPDLQTGPNIRDAATLPLGFWGTQAIKVKLEAMQHLQRVSIPEHAQKMSCDIWLGEQIASKGAVFESFEIIRPSLFQHIGLASIAHPEKPGSLRRAVDFDVTFNALSILPKGEPGRSDDKTPVVMPASIQRPGDPF